MILHRYRQVISKIAMFLVVFASLAPSVTHALATHSNGSFLQEICSSNGIKKIVIQTITTHGQQLTTVFDTKNSNENTPASNALHLEHCPFCSAGAVNVAVAPNSPWVFMLAEQAKAIDFDYVTPVQPSYIQTAHPTRAPPVL
ncbi:MAG: DUF2946 domain-containing protein [Methylophilaceae bacterium]